VEFGFHGTPTSRIAQNAGISHGTLFLYFKTKDDLVVSLYNKIKNDINTYVGEKVKEVKGVEDRFKQTFYHSVRWAVAHREDNYFTMQFHYSPHLKLVGKEEMARQNSLNQALVLEAIQSKILKPLPAEIIIGMARGQMISVFNYLVQAGLSKKEQEKIILETAELTWNMLAIGGKG
jgi:AcrR family transcriptional regulator